MENTNINSEKIYKTYECQRKAVKKYAMNHKDKIRNIYNNYYKKNEEYRLHKIDITKKAYHLKKECNIFLKILLD